MSRLEEIDALMKETRLSNGVEFADRDIIRLRAAVAHLLSEHRRIEPTLRKTEQWSQRAEEAMRAALRESDAINGTALYRAMVAIEQLLAEHGDDV